MSKGTHVAPSKIPALPLVPYAAPDSSTSAAAVAAQIAAAKQPVVQTPINAPITEDHQCAFGYSGGEQLMKMKHIIHLYIHTYT